MCGRIILWLSLPNFLSQGDKKAVCEFKEAGFGDVIGKIYIVQELGASTATYTVELSGLKPGKHGLHVHQNGDLGDNCAAAGGHFDPHNVENMMDNLVIFYNTLLLGDT